MDLVQADCVIDHLDEPTVGSSRQDLVRFQPHVQLFDLENLVDEADKLHRELLLPHVVVCFHDES